VLNEKRASARRMVNWRALLVRADGKPSRECKLLDISETGARIALQDTSNLPELFTIEFTASGTPKRICRLVWTSETDIGVAFESKTPAPRMLQPGISREEAVNAFGFEL
jgi:hypothetical protein